LTGLGFGVVVEGGLGWGVSGSELQSACQHCLNCPEHPEGMPCSSAVGQHMFLVLPTRVVSMGLDCQGSLLGT
jgi:hypothetical protein